MKDDLSRRSALVGLGLAVAGCGSSGGSDDTTDPTSPVPTGGTSTKPSSPGTSDPPAPPATSTPTEPDPVLTPKQLLAGIEHIVVLMMENRSFDHFLGSLASDAGYPGKGTIEGLKGTESNAAPDGTVITTHKMDNFAVQSPPHGWDASHIQFDNGTNDGFVKAYAGPNQADAMGHHDRTQIPFYYWLADNFTICDHWHASLLGPTWPNRYYMHSCTSGGKKDNSSFYVGGPDTIWDRLKTKNVSAKNYFAGPAPFYLGGYAAKVLQLNPTVTIDKFFDDAQKGTLPSFSLIDPDFNASDDHPDHNIQRGQAFVSSVYKALAESPNWNKTLFVITYDEAGGFFDHVVPPAAQDDNAEFQNYGFRVPAIVVGATVKKGYVAKTVYDHTSVAATLKTRFDIADLTLRQQKASDISDCIDPKKVNAPSPPPTGMPVVAMTAFTALNDGVGPSSQPVLDRMIQHGEITGHDTRSHQQRIGSWLEHAVRLGAVRIVGSTP